MADKSFFGLDIGTYSIKMIELSHVGHDRQLTNVGLAPTPPGATISESKFDRQALAASIKKLSHEAQINTPYAVVSLPESQVFTRIIEMPYLTDKELASAISFEAEQYIPAALNEVSLVWHVISKPQTTTADAKMEILLVAAPLTLVNRYTEILEDIGVTPLALETESLATARSLVGTNPYSPTTLIANIGASTTDVSIIRGGSLVFTRSVATGGMAFTRAISVELGFPLPQAEEYKKTYGLAEGQLDGKIAQALKPIVDVISAEIKRALLSYREKGPDDIVKRVVLCGGSAKLPGLVVYLAQILGLEVQIGDPWFNIKKDQQRLRVLVEDAPIYAVAAGLALREV